MEEEKKKKIIEDAKRIFSSLILFPLVAIILIFGNTYIIDIALTAVALLAMKEYLNVVAQKANPVKWIAYLSCILISVIHIIPNQYLSQVGFLALPVLMVLLFLQIIITNMKTNFNDIAYTFIGICYIVFGIMCASLVRGMNNGVVLIWYVLFAGWGTDVFGYAIGKRFGKHKFSQVSPKKSIEGCIAGIIGAILLIVGYTFSKYSNVISSIFILSFFIAYITCPI